MARNAITFYGKAIISNCTFSIIKVVNVFSANFKNFDIERKIKIA